MDGSLYNYRNDLPTPVLEVQLLTFLGLFVHRDIIQRVGLPDAAMFLAGDDIDYCERARNMGARLQGFQGVPNFW
jgi:GT2 family glycosyltransferase